MAIEIIWTAKARVSFLGVLKYLDREWSQSVALEFKNRVDLVVRYLRRNPKLGKIEEGLPDNIRSYLVSKQTKLFYRVVNNEVQLIKFFDTRQDPNRALE